MPIISQLPTSDQPPFLLPQMVQFPHPLKTDPAPRPVSRSRNEAQSEKSPVQRKGKRGALAAFEVERPGTSYAVDCESTP